MNSATHHHPSSCVCCVPPPLLIHWGAAATIASPSKAPLLLSTACSRRQTHIVHSNSASATIFCDVICFPLVTRLGFSCMSSSSSRESLCSGEYPYADDPVSIQLHCPVGTHICTQIDSLTPHASKSGTSALMKASCTVHVSLISHRPLYFVVAL